MSRRSSVVVSILAASVLAGAHDAARAVECALIPAVSCDKAGPQSPRDIEKTAGNNPVKYAKALPVGNLRLCDIHFHKLAEHKIPATSPAPGGKDGYACKAGAPSSALQEQVKADPEGCVGIVPGDTIEVHWVYTSCDVEPAPCLTSCFSDACMNPELRVETQVFYLTAAPHGDGDDWARRGYSKLPPKAGARTVEYLGSTTGDSYSDTKCSPIQATWNVRPDCRPLTLESLNNWCDDNPFNEDHPHGVRKLVTLPQLLSRIP